MLIRAFLILLSFMRSISATAMRTDAALWCTEKARLARKWIVRYGRTYRFLAVPKRENLKADFKKVRLLGVPPFLFLGFNYTAFSYFYSLVERYEFREVQFSSIGLDALLDLHP